MDSNDLEKLYRDKLQNLEINPSTAVWDKIEQSLDAEKKSNKKAIIWWSSAASIAALFILSFFLWKPSNDAILNKNRYTKALILKENNPILTSKGNASQITKTPRKETIKEIPSSVQKLETPRKKTFFASKTSTNAQKNQLINTVLLASKKPNQKKRYNTYKNRQVF